MIACKARGLLALAALSRARGRASPRRAPPRRASRCPGPAATVRVDAAGGEIEDATVVVHGVRGRLSAHVGEGSAAFLSSSLSVLRVATTRVAGRSVADPLPPLQRRAAVAGTPVRLVLRFRVPEGTAPGLYDGRLVFASDGRPFATLPVRLRVFAVQLPARDDPAGFRTLFLIRPGVYVDAVAERSGASSGSIGAGVTDRLYAFLSDYRISPGDWGSGTPYPDGYSRPPRLVRGRGDAHVRRGRASVPDDAAAARHAALRAFAHRPVGAGAVDVGGLSDRPRPAVLARARLARSRARVGLGRARCGLRAPVRGAAGLRCARSGSDLSDDSAHRSGASRRAA